MSRLILLTHTYPYARGEEFLETELPYLCEVFDQAEVIPVDFSDPHDSMLTRRLPKGCTLRSDIARSINAAPAERSVGARFSWLSRADALRLLASDLPRATRYGPVAVRRLIGFVHRATVIQQRLEAYYGASLGSDTILYSYWLGTSAVGASLASKGAPCVARAHGGDIYEDRRRPPYIPLLRETICRLDRVYAISEHGRRYLGGRYPKLAFSLRLSRLGVRAAVGQAPQTIDGTFRILSCAYMTRNKRLDCLVHALSLCDGHIDWTHIGDGPESEHIRSLAAALPERVTTHFLGHIPNSEVLRYYAEHSIDLFVSCSASEGLPVTLMEAMSYGLPVLATDVGGVSELVDESNGHLLDPQATPKDVAKALKHHLSLDPAARQAMSAASLARWKEKVDADKQYGAFAAELAGLVARGNPCDVSGFGKYSGLRK